MLLKLEVPLLVLPCKGLMIQKGVIHRLVVIQEFQIRVLFQQKMIHIKVFFHLRMMIPNLVVLHLVQPYNGMTLLQAMIPQGVALQERILHKHKRVFIPNGLLHNLLYLPKLLHNLKVLQKGLHQSRVVLQGRIFYNKAFFQEKKIPDLAVLQEGLLPHLENLSNLLHHSREALHQGLL